MLKRKFLSIFFIVVVLLIIIILFISKSITYLNKINTEKRSESISDTKNIELYSYGNNLSISLYVKITDNKYGINYIQYPNGNIIYCNNKKEIAFDYKITNLDEDYTFFYLNGNNEKIYFKKHFYNLFSYTGDYQIFTTPETGNYRIECAGASGYYDSGKGTYASGILNLQKGEQLYIYVGEGNKSSGIAYNGGGSGYYGSGGGATDVRLQNGLWNNFESLKSRIMIAAGGGGSGGQGANYKGGDGRYSLWR